MLFKKVFGQRVNKEKFSLDPKAWLYLFGSDLTLACLLFCIEIIKRILVASSMYYVASLDFFLLLTTCHMLLYTLAVLLLWPIDWLVKQIIISRAQFKIKN